MTRTRKRIHRFQRAAGWCKAVMQAFVSIPSEQRTENGVFPSSRLRRLAPDTAHTSAAPGQNESGTAEVYLRLCLFCKRQRRFYLGYLLNIFSARFPLDTKIFMEVSFQWNTKTPLSPPRPTFP